MVRAGLVAGRVFQRRWTLVRGIYSSAIRAKPDHGVKYVDVLDTLSRRSLLAQVTAPNSLQKHLSGHEQRSVYVGVDPSADSLHVGNLLPLLAALHFIHHGHRVVVVIGGATGSIGDPSGRSTERSALSPSQLAINVERITAQVHSFFIRAGDLLQRQSPSPVHVKDGGVSEETPMQAAAEFTTITEAQVASERAMNMATAAPGSQPLSGTDVEGARGGSGDAIASSVTVVNNEEWYRNMNVLAFLRDVGKLARVGTMLARDSVKSRLQPTKSSESSTQSAVGLSFTEFSYQLLQAYDFSVLHGAPWNCTVQLGGSDQMGNIMAGVDLIRRQKAIQEDRKGEEHEGEGEEQTPAYGVTLPLLTTSSGAKFGKSAGNAVWLSSDRCSDYDFYQFFYRSRDDEVHLYLKTLTMLPLAMIESIMRAHGERPAARRAQMILATQVTELVRGQRAVNRAQTASRILFETQLHGLQADDVLEAFEGDPRMCHAERRDWMGVELASLAVETGLTKSKGEARRAMASGGFYLNNAAVGDAKRQLREEDAICQGNLVILRLGRAEHRIVSLR